MKLKYIFLLLVILILISVIGCSSYKNNEKDHIAYISTNINSEYYNTFKDLDLGIIYDFNIKLPNADKSWVNIWVEGYSNGKQIKSSHLTEISCGLYLKKVEEGRFGLGIINPQTENELFFLYGPSVRNETVALRPGETKIIGVYRQGIDSIKNI
ncbi:MAG: hypothetical protein FH753_02545 [Firmicutes bacterium]|nr:hypothetical protein [Bacillota bacterium]